MIWIESWRNLRRAMVKIDLKGIAKVTAKGRTYYYAWRGGPRLRGEPGSPQFVASYNQAVEDRRAPDQSRFKSVVGLYKASEDYRALAETTKRKWGPWLDRIAAAQPMETRSIVWLLAGMA
jgi:hypothetical protein